MAGHCPIRLVHYAGMCSTGQSRSVFNKVQDIASYIIARTLGVIEDAKASTSDSGSAVEIYSSTNEHGNPTTPTIVIQPDPLEIPIPDDNDLEDEPQAFGVGNLKLSGVGVFSPVCDVA